MKRADHARVAAPAGAGVARHGESTVREGNLLYSSLLPVGGRETIPDMLRRNLGLFADAPVHRTRAGDGFTEASWRELLFDVARFGTFLRARGIGTGDRVLVVSRNRAEMLVAELAAMSIGALHTPIFAGYAAEQTQALAADSGAVAALLSDAGQLAKLTPSGTIRMVVHCDPVADGPERRAWADAGRPLLPFAEALREGTPGGDPEAAIHAFLDSCGSVRPDSPCLTMYTSGTSGNQKGVVLTHDNILSQRRALARIWNIGPRDRFLSYLPWHHSFGGLFEKFTALYFGAPITLDDSLGKDFQPLLRNWKAVRPTVYFSVPAVYQRLVDHVQLHPEDGPEIFHPELKFVFTAAAPLPANISAFFAARGIPVLEGWGLTETSPCCTLTDPAEPRSVQGVVGYPIPDVKIRLAEDGEILVQGPNVMLGYHGREEATQAVLSRDGWFRTGDIGEICGSALRLVARKDRIFKLLNGEYVIPTPLEDWLAGRSPYIRHAVIAGSGREGVSVLIFPNLPLIEMEFGADRRTADRVVAQSFREAILDLNREHPVQYERIRAFAVISRELSVDRDELTPSMKVRFSNVLKRHWSYIEAIYEPSRDCDCRFLRKIVRLTPDGRRCFRGKDVTLDRCHECDLLLTPEAEDR